MTISDRAAPAGGRLPPPEAAFPRRRKPSPPGKVAGPKALTDEGPYPNNKKGYVKWKTHPFNVACVSLFGCFPSSGPGCARSTFPVGEGVLPAGDFTAPAGDLRGNFNFPTGQVGKRRAFSQKNPNIFRKKFSFFFGTRKNAENLAHLCKKTNRRPVSV